MNRPPCVSALLAVVDRGRYVALLRLDQLSEPTPVLLEGSALEIWRLIDGTRMPHQLTEELATRHGFAVDDLLPQVEAFLESLAYSGLIEADARVVDGTDASRL